MTYHVGVLDGRARARASRAPMTSTIQRRRRLAAARAAHVVVEVVAIAVVTSLLLGHESQHATLEVLVQLLCHVRVLCHTKRHGLDAWKITVKTCSTVLKFLTNDTTDGLRGGDGGAQQ